jgi:hypothetical protein
MPNNFNSFNSLNNFNDETNLNIKQNSYDKDWPKGEQAIHNSEVKKCIDDLLTQKRLKALLDDINSWGIYSMILHKAKR